MDIIYIPLIFELIFHSSLKIIPPFWFLTNLIHGWNLYSNSDKVLQKEIHFSICLNVTVSWPSANTSLFFCVVRAVRPKFQSDELNWDISNGFQCSSCSWFCLYIWHRSWFVRLRTTWMRNRDYVFGMHVNPARGQRRHSERRNPVLSWKPCSPHC